MIDALTGEEISEDAVKWATHTGKRPVDVHRDCWLNKRIVAAAEGGESKVEVSPAFWLWHLSRLYGDFVIVGDGVTVTIAPTIVDTERPEIVALRKVLDGCAYGTADARAHAATFRQIADLALEKLAALLGVEAKP